MYVSPVSEKTVSEQPEFLFAGRRAATYRGALELYPEAWADDLARMRRDLHPVAGERILEIGAGNGYFSRAISADLGAEGLLVASDPSTDQLEGLEAESGGRIKVFGQGADVLDLPVRGFDAAWSRGAFHHILDKTEAMKAIGRHMKPGGRLLVADIFSGGPLAAYFDDFIARSCCTGHEVSFLSREFAGSLCTLTGWGEPRFTDVTTRWAFASRADLGHFLHLLFSATDDYDDADSLTGAERHLEVAAGDGGVALLWPMTVMETRWEG